MTSPPVERPAIDPAVAADLIAAAPARVRKRLDADPAAAEAWVWESAGGAWTVGTGTETVTLSPVTGVITAAEQATCSCLLSPRCLHLLSVVTRLAPDLGATDPGTGDQPRPEPDRGATDPGTADQPRPELPGREIAPDQRAAAEAAWDAGARLLLGGLRGSGALLQADLLRSAALARRADLPALSAAIAQVIGQARSLADDDPGFSLGTAVAATASLLESAHVLAGRGRPVLDDDVGSHRRTYGSIGTIGLLGLGTEAVATDRGFAGVVTHLVSSDGRPYSVADVVPGGADRVPGAYRAPVRLGPTSVDHAAAGRSRWHLQGATASDDGRLGGGKSVKAARGSRPEPDDPTWREVWTQPLSHQVRSGADLIRLRATVIGPAVDGVAIDTVDGPLTLVAPEGSAPPEMAPNLGLLASAAGLEFALLARRSPRRPRALVPIAVHLDPDDRAGLPPAWEGVVNLGLDRLVASHLPGTAPAPGDGDRPPDASVEAAPSSPPRPPFDLVGARLGRMLLGGAITMGPAAARGVALDRRRLDAARLPTGAQLIGALHESLLMSDRSLRGQASSTESDGPARAWLAAEIWVRAARAAADDHDWLATPE